MSARKIPSGDTARRVSGSIALWGITLIVVLLLIMPTLVVIPASFSSASSFQFPPKELSFRWYQRLFSSSQWMSSFYLSLKIAFVVACASTVAGTLAAFGLDKLTAKWRAPIRLFLTAPMTLPSVIIGIGMYSVFLKWNIAGTVTGLVVAHMVLALPFVVTNVYGALISYDRNLDLASASMGAGWLTTKFRITIPLLAPGISAGFLFSFVCSLDEAVVSRFIQSPGTRTMPVQMFNAINLDIDPTISAAASVMVVLTTGLLVALQFVKKDKEDGV